MHGIRPFGSIRPQMLGWACLGHLLPLRAVMSAPLSSYNLAISPA